MVEWWVKRKDRRVDDRRGRNVINVYAVTILYCPAADVRL